MLCCASVLQDASYGWEARLRVEAIARPVELREDSRLPTITLSNIHAGSTLAGHA